MNVLVVHLGPVQEFIESARKCRDLWFGSWLLSELARAAARGIVTREGRAEPAVLVFPGAKTSDTGRMVSNRVVARVSGAPRALAEAAERAMRERLRAIRDRAFERVGWGHPQRDALFHQRPAKEQVDDLIEFLWASAQEGDRGYKTALDEADALLAAVKNTRAWGQPSWALRDGIPKSSLDGVRESVLDEALFPRPRGQEQPPFGDHDQALRRSFGVHGSERLCGVGLLKRFGNREDAAEADHPERIFSTSHVASGSFRAGLQQLDAREPWSRFCDALEGIDAELTAEQFVPRPDPTTRRVDGAVFYEGRLLESLEELGYDPVADRATFESARKALRAFLREVKPLGEPLPYFAVLHADGDRMGLAIDKVTDFEQHRALSERLEGFASSTRATVEDADGALVYAGGDDVLALLPLHSALACAKALSDGFRDAMSNWPVLEGTVYRAPTLSVGLAVVHHLLPLDEALALARKAEKNAKRVPGKDALAIVVKKRGGEAVEVAGSWSALDERLRVLVELHRKRAISSKTQYELMDLSARLDRAGSLTSILAQVRRAEALRILTRKRAEGGRRLLDAPARERLSELGVFDDPARLGRELYVASLFAQAADQAHPKEATASVTRTQETSP